MLREGPMVDAHRVTLSDEDDFAGWRDAARGLAEAGVPPSAIRWEVSGGEADLFAALPDTLPPPDGPSFAVPRAFIDVAKAAICHSDPERFALLYEMLLKLRSNRRAMEDRADPLLDRIERLAKEVRRDAHKMHAFVRFREIEEEDGARFVAWFEPDHHIVRREAGFFMRRFANMRWSILTPELTIHWDGNKLTEGPGATRAEAPDGDPVEETWKTYYASIFNPARVKVKAMTKEMPKKYWKNMPETALIGDLIAGAQKREAAMLEMAPTAPGIETSRGQEPMPRSNIRASWEALRDEAAHCTRCDLYQCATQTVFGEGPLDASIIFVGEQPGDQEDLAGKPFVGPAGEVFNAALEAAGIDRKRTYVTNAVKHFKFVLKGKKRIHSRPDVGEIDACRWWQEQERGLIRPALTVALGATAARSLTGKTVTISRVRDEPLTLADGSECWVTVHPSFLLRLPDEDARRTERARFVSDLKRIGERAAALAA
ncbi:UdgX family uracil-DNA binding protein [Sphingomonas sp. LY160]|uniref:UdgX family uracil-DNA binding protein n=1 Tax=Sphingomonas sp. LY160 TaxID=3095342 RepID=UPI002ADEA7A5|nr:UdgX family uracil-DNA binding protein [Sphingomonas sp. LY160]MEA1072098.1 UdgX family uracil-DNA binding protein [Sphingomonas sp. LY160]